MLCAVTHVAMESSSAVVAAAPILTGVGIAGGGRAEGISCLHGGDGSVAGYRCQDSLPREREGEREEGSEGAREGGKEGGREGGKEGGREERGTKGEREGGRKGGRENGKKEGRERYHNT